MEDKWKEESGEITNCVGDGCEFTGTKEEVEKHEDGCVSALKAQKKMLKDSLESVKKENVGDITLKISPKKETSEFVLSIIPKQVDPPISSGEASLKKSASSASGEKVESLVKENEQLFKLVVEYADPQVLSNLAYQYKNGTEGMEQNINKAILLYERACEKENPTALVRTSLFFLGFSST